MVVLYLKAIHRKSVCTGRTTLQTQLLEPINDYQRSRETAIFLVKTLFLFFQSLCQTLHMPLSVLTIPITTYQNMSRGPLTATSTVFKTSGPDFYRSSFTEFSSSYFWERVDGTKTRASCVEPEKSDNTSLC